MRDRAGVVCLVQAVGPLITNEGFVTRQNGPQLLPADPRNIFPHLPLTHALGGSGMVQVRVWVRVLVRVEV